MFKTWLETHDLNDYNYDGRLIPTISDRKFWESFPIDVKADIIAKAESYMDYEFPTIRATDFLEFGRSGNRNIMEGKHNPRRIALHLMMLAECFENKGRFIDDITNVVFLICEESYWGLSAHRYKGEPIPIVTDPYIDLFAAETASSIAFFRYLFAEVYQKELPELLDRVDYELERRIKVQFMKHTDYYWMGYNGRVVNNWVPWIISNILSVFLLCEDDKAKKVAAIERCFEHLQFFVGDYAPDGGCNEGTGYWSKAGGSLFQSLEQLYVATNGGITFGDVPLVREILRYMLHLYIDGRYFVNYADGSATPGPDPTLIFRYGKYIGDEQMCAFAKHISGNGKGLGASYFRDMIMKLCTNIELQKYNAEYMPERDAYLPDLEVITARASKDSARGLYLSAKGGHNAESHNHNDIGTYIVYYNGSPVIVDAGVGIYTRQTFDNILRYTIWTMQSDWHNLPVVNGCGEKNGREFAADKFEYSCDDNKVTLTVGLKNTYLPEAGIAGFDRNFAFDRADNARIDVTDNISFANNGNSVSESILVCAEPVVSDGVITLFSKNGDKLRLSYDAKLLSATVEKKPTDGDKRLTPVWGDHLWRISLSANGLGKNAEIKYTISEE